MATDRLNVWGRKLVSCSLVMLSVVGVRYVLSGNGDPLVAQGRVAASDECLLQDVEVDYAVGWLDAATGHVVTGATLTGPPECKDLLVQVMFTNADGVALGAASGRIATTVTALVLEGDAPLPAGDVASMSVVLFD